MHLLIDGQALQTSSSRQRGIGRYSSNLLRALAAVRPNWQIEVVQNNTLPPIAADDLNGLPVLSFQPPLDLYSENRELQERYYADWLTARGADSVLILSHCENWEAIVPSFCGPRPRIFGIAYDLIPLLYPGHYLTDNGAAHWYAHRFRHFLRSDALLAISEATARDVRTLGGEEAPLVVNIGGAVDPLFAPLPPAELAVRAEQVRARFGLQRDFILYVGAPDYRKNLRGALRAFGALPADCRASLDLAVVCRMKPAEKASIERTARRAGVAASLRLICSAGDEDLRALYQMCRLFFFPSLYEGLGLPLLEALHCGAPVVTSNCSSLPEYAGPVSWLGDPASPQAMGQVLQQALAEPREARRHERQAFAQTFSWAKTAERACTVMERSTKRANPSRRRRRVAWVAPLTAATRDMSEVAAQLLPFLAERFDIELIAGHDDLETPETLARHHLILTTQEVAARHTALPYDMFVYQFRPSPRNSAMLALLRRFPGLLVLHNFSIEDLNSLVENRLLPAPASGDSLQDTDSPADDSAPVLGMLVHTAQAWQQARRATNCPVVHFSTPSSTTSKQPTATESVAAAYAAWIDWTIDRHEQSDGLWRGFAAQCLADCANEVDTVIDSWASLRARGQQRFTERRPRAAAGYAPLSAV